jgi:hypothetical protein
MLNDLMNFFLLLLISTFFLKFVFWFLISDVNKRVKFIPSFLQLYSMYQMHDAPSKKTVTFWKASNILNVLFWLSVTCILFLQLNMLFKSTI